MTPEMIETLLAAALGTSLEPADLERSVALVRSSLAQLDAAHELIIFETEPEQFGTMLDMLAPPEDRP
jgi:hypothetical protein